MPRNQNATHSMRAVDDNVVEAAIRALVEHFRLVQAGGPDAEHLPANPKDLLVAFDRAMTVRPAADVDDALLRDLAGCLVAQDTPRCAPFFVWSRLLTTGSNSSTLARGRALLSVQGAGAALEKRLRDSEVRTASTASMMLGMLCRHDELIPLLVASAPGLLDATFAKLATLVPRAAAAEVGLDVSSSTGEDPQSPDAFESLHRLLLLVGHLSRAKQLPGVEPQDLPRVAVPTLVAAMATPDFRTAQLAATGLYTFYANFQSPAFLEQCLVLGERGLIRGLARCLEEDLRRARSRRDARRRPDRRGPPRLPPRAAEPLDSLMQVAFVLQHIIAHILLRPKRMLGRAAGAWARGWEALRLVVAVDALGQLNREVGGFEKDDEDQLQRAKQSIARLKVFRDVTESLCDDAGTLAPETTPPATQPQASVRVMRWQCAVCCKTRADGAHLRRCRGCGVVTGVMYCGEACAREHWVKRGHRALCDVGRTVLKALERYNESTRPT